jgi:hypothetical protein
MASESIRDPVKDQLLPRLLGAILLIAGATANHSAFAQTGPLGQTADTAPHSTAMNEPVLTGVAAHFRSGPYVRVIFPSEAGAFVERYVGKLGGHLAWDFEFPAAHVRVIGLESKLGNLWRTLFDCACLMESTPAVELMDELARRPDEPLVRGQAANGFDRTVLDTILRLAGVDTLVLVGIATDVAVESTARAASDLIKENLSRDRRPSWSLLEQKLPCGNPSSAAVSGSKDAKPFHFIYQGGAREP